jgi:hypothetical protein
MILRCKNGSRRMRLIRRLRAADRASNLLARWATFDPALSQAETAVAQLPDAVASVPAVTKEYVLQQIGYCLNAVIQFSDPTKLEARVCGSRTR